MKIDEAVIIYQTTKCEDSFRAIYEYIYGNDRKIVSAFSRRYSLDELDVESMINEKILDIAGKFDNSRGKFKNAVYRAIKYGCLDLIKKRDREEVHTSEVMLEDDDGNINEVYEVIAVAPTTDEDSIIEEVQKKHDQRQLIAFLLSNANEPTLTSAIAFIETNSYRKAAKQIGTTDKTVKSRIRSLSKRFDENRFGNYRDYFTAPTSYVG